MMSSRYPVEVIRSERRVKTVSARIVDGVIRVRIPSWMSDADEQKFVADVVEKIEQERRSHAIDLDTRAARLADDYGLPRPESIRWSKTQQQRWGSCSVHSGHIRISNRLVDVPPWVLDHVIIHELAHLEVADHSPAFHALVERYPLAERATGYLLALNDRLDRIQPLEDVEPAADEGFDELDAAG
ncbi:MAG: YgjP-like metallopeptidase domain-containing protein [Acidimicrobiales bacterium]|nr:YgjP-like metallopeptidase domain-containing protein [Acidimicrobiales bacterium]